MIALDWEKIDKFYIVLSLVLILMAILIIFSFRGVFTAFIKAYELDQKAISSDTKIEKEKLDEVSKWLFNKESVPLEITQ